MASLELLDVVTSLSLYVHIPWCVKKCPYCDFNSHALSADGRLAPELAETYVEQLITDLHADLGDFGLSLAFTLSLLVAAPSYSRSNRWIAFGSHQCRNPIEADAEITLEAVDSADQRGLRGYRLAGVNRLSLSVQSFDDHSLKHLGQLHDGAEAKRAIDGARAAGFST